MTSREPEDKGLAVGPDNGQELYGQDPASYAAGRPDYPERVYDVLVNRCRLREGSRVVEIGPGTGLTTAKLLSLGASVTAVEPNASMARYLEQTLDGEALDVVVAPFEDAPLPAGSFDLAIAANSFHWVDPDIGPQKLGRLVAPGGWVAIWGMLFDDPTRRTEFSSALRDLLGPPLVSVTDPGHLQLLMDEAARLPSLRQAGFLDVESELIRSEVTLNAVQVRALYTSMTIILRRSPSEQPLLLDSIEGIVRDQFGGHVDLHFVTGLATARHP
jgi:SAM-dependent methyltransferase